MIKEPSKLGKVSLMGCKPQGKIKGSFEHLEQVAQEGSD